MSEIKMLPLPEADNDVAVDGEGNETFFEFFNAEQMREYARAVAEHNVRFLTHELANAECAIDAEQAGRKEAEAEIEALRAEVERWRILHNGEIARRMDADDCAERLTEALRDALEAVRGALQDAHQNAEQECCGRSVGMHDCCGAPETVWTPEDQAVMDKLGPIERLLSSALRDHDQEARNG